MNKTLSYIFILLFLSGLVNAQMQGDVNNNDIVDIVDALLVAQYYVELDPDNFDWFIADVNGNGNIEITDAFLISQYYVRLIYNLPVNKLSKTQGLPEGYNIIGYFTQWGIYKRNYFVKNIVQSKTAPKLTVLNYAFGNIVDCECIMTTRKGVMDGWADYRRPFLAEESVDGVGDLPDQSLKGNFNQLKKLKKMYPHLKILISLGGWTWSEGFHDASKSKPNRQKLIHSCIDLYIKGNLPIEGTAGGVAVASGIFDGFDIDWEYPNNPGAGNSYGPEDTENFTRLLREFRKQLNELDPNLLLSIAGPAGEKMFANIQLNRIHYYLDWINIMNYDYHGAWEKQGPTNHMSALFSSSNDPSYGYIKNFYTDYTIQKYLEAGVPAYKLNLGVPFYGRGWSGVTNKSDGLYQPASGPAQGTYNLGTEDYKLIKFKGYEEYWDPVAEASWCFNGDIFWSFDSPRSLENKMNYIKKLGLGGVMFWELSADTYTGELITTIYKNLN